MKWRPLGIVAKDDFGELNGLLVYALKLSSAEMTECGSQSFVMFCIPQLGRTNRNS